MGDDLLVIRVSCLCGSFVLFVTVACLFYRCSLSFDACFAGLVVRCWDVWVVLSYDVCCSMDWM